MLPFLQGEMRRGPFKKKKRLREQTFHFLVLLEDFFFLFLLLCFKEEPSIREMLPCHLICPKARLTGPACHPGPQAIPLLTHKTSRGAWEQWVPAHWMGESQRGQARAQRRKRWPASSRGEVLPKSSCSAQRKVDSNLHLPISFPAQDSFSHTPNRLPTGTHTHTTCFRQMTSLFVKQKRIK